MTEYDRDDLYFILAMIDVTLERTKPGSVSHINLNKLWMKTSTIIDSLPDD